jgi:hypothetical protein
MQGFVYEQALTYKTSNTCRASQAILFYSEKNIHTLKSLSEEFVLFDEWFCAVPGPTNSNRASLLARGTVTEAMMPPSSSPPFPCALSSKSSLKRISLG